MEIEILNELNRLVSEGKTIALSTVIKSEGSTPRKVGAMMLSDENGIIAGTVGGGKIELATIEKAKECVRKEISESFHFELNEKEGSLNMACGGATDVFIQIFQPEKKLLIAGGGHIALELEKMGRQLHFKTVIFDERDEFVSRERYPDADMLICGDIGTELNKYPIDKNCYIVIVTKGHHNDYDALKAVIDREPAYIGMIGSRNKVKVTFDRLVSENIERALTDRVFAPCGLSLGGGAPVEIALSIMAEILLVKNNGSLNHMKNRK